MLVILKSWSLYFAWLIALLGALLSFFYSEIALIEPCVFCWYQRIFLFPLVIQLGMAAYRSERLFVFYAYPLAALGAFSALYQSFLPLMRFVSCGTAGDCGKDQPDLFGIPLPWLSVMGFLLILLLLWISSRRQEV